MNILIYTDLHIRKEDLRECELVQNEIVSLCNIHKVSQVYNLGDTFDKVLPESECLDLFANFIKKLNRPIKIVVANSHESTNEILSVLNHFELLSSNITVAKEFIDDNHMYCGHFTLAESKVNYGATKTVKDFRNFKYVFLGHQHTYELIKPNVCQLGACRYIDFAEANDRAKVVCLIENYKGESEKVHFIGLKSPYPMRDIELCKREIRLETKDSSNATYVSPVVCGEGIEDNLKRILQLIASETKIRLIFNDFESYSAVLNDLAFYKSKFVLFKEKKNFIADNNFILAKKENISIKESLTKYLSINNVAEDIKQILLETIK